MELGLGKGVHAILPEEGGISILRAVFENNINTTFYPDQVGDAPPHSASRFSRPWVCRGSGLPFDLIHRGIDNGGGGGHMVRWGEGLRHPDQGDATFGG